MKKQNMISHHSTKYEIKGDKFTLMFYYLLIVII